MICPKCGKAGLRTARQGKNAGNKFYGCSNFPKYRYTVNVEKNGRILNSDIKIFAKGDLETLSFTTRDVCLRDIEAYAWKTDIESKYYIFSNRKDKEIYASFFWDQG